LAEFYWAIPFSLSEHNFLPDNLSGAIFTSWQGDDYGAGLVESSGKLRHGLCPVLPQQLQVDHVQL
jgi:hypothetical protein